MQVYRNSHSNQRPVKQSKIQSQRQYRVKEGDGFQELRDVIRLVTGEAPQTRRDILTKGLELDLKCALHIHALYSCRIAEADI